MHTLSPTLRTYIEAHIIPLYDTFDPAHQRNHVLSVIDRSMALAAHYDVNPDMVYAIAAYHDTGLSRDRQTHHLVSGLILRGDHNLKQWFDAEQIEVMVEAVEDHRASNAHEPRSIYGKIVAEADRLIDPYTILSRALLFGLSHHPELNEQAQIARATHHLIENMETTAISNYGFPNRPIINDCMKSDHFSTPLSYSSKHFSKSMPNSRPHHPPQNPQPAKHQTNIPPPPST